MLELSNGRVTLLEVLDRSVTNSIITSTSQEYAKLKCLMKLNATLSKVSYHTDIVRSTSWICENHF